MMIAVFISVLQSSINSETTSKQESACVCSVWDCVLERNNFNGLQCLL